MFKEIFRVLKPGGELYFRRITNARISKEFHDDPVAYGECLGGLFILRILDAYCQFGLLRLSDYLRERLISMINSAKKAGLLNFIPDCPDF